MSMSTAILDDDHAERISHTRGQLLTELAAGIQAVQRAAETLQMLCSPSVYDIELVDGRDGHDVARFLDDTIRYGRAAYAVMHAIIDKETP